MTFHKKKYWEGLRRGERSKFSVEADGSYELTGSVHAQDSVAQASATIHIANHALPIFKADASAHTRPDGAAGRVYLEAMGMTVGVDDQKGETIAIVNPTLLSYEFKEQVTQNFAIGPIPVYLTEGALSRLKVGFELGLAANALRANLGPGVDADAFVLAGVGIPLVSVGVACELKLLDMDAGLQGSLALGLERESVPLLEGDINVGIGYTALKGRAFAFAELPVPRFGLPPWVRKRIGVDLFNWGGFHERHRLINWGMRLTSYSAKLRGDLIDQADRDEMRALEVAVTAEARQAARAKLTQELNDRSAQVYHAILDDVDAETSRSIVRDAAVLQAEVLQFATVRENYLQQLGDLLRDVRG